jgi:CubicO group peptidase (beta-lactamase class C family)
MPSRFDPVEAILRDAVGSVFTAAAAQVRFENEVVYSVSLGTLDPEGRPGIGDAVEMGTRFDFASLTKLFTATAFFRLFDAGVVKLDTPVRKVLPDFAGVRPIGTYPNPLNIAEQIAVVPPTDQQIDAGTVTFWHLLTHSSGLPAWLNLREAATIPDRMALCLNSHFAYVPGTQVVYSDIGFILLGAAVAKLYGAPFERALDGLVLTPMGFEARFGPIAANVAPTEWDPWRGRRIIGEVHDENSATLDGVAGHAGLFGTVTDVASLGEIYLDKGANLISPEIAEAAVTRQIDDRGLGWMMRSAEGSSSGRYFSPESYGHTGFVGNSVWVDPERKLVCALLTNNVFYGRDKDKITAFRTLFHDTVIEALEGRP